jgi:carbon storage regulator
MLILTRRVGEAIMVGDEVQVIVLGVRGSLVRNGITAPQDMRVDREEVRERIDAEKASACSVGGGR